jgi:RND family efflux transporter MFP subunit
MLFSPAMATFFLKHKFLVVAIIVVALVGGGYYVHARKPAQPLRYVTAAATQGSLVVALQGSGQVSGQNQLDLKPLVSGQITDVRATSGDAIKTGQILFQIDNKMALRDVRDAAQAVNDARISLQAAQLSIQKLKEPPDALSLLQAQNSINAAERALAKLQDGPDPLDLQQAEADLQTQKDRAKLASDGVTPQVLRDAYDAAVPVLKTTAQSFQQMIFDSEDVLGTRNGQVRDPYSNPNRDTQALVTATNAYSPAKNAVDHLRAEVDVLPVAGASTADIDAAILEAQRVATNLENYLRLVYSVTLSMVPTQSQSQTAIDQYRSTIQSDRSTISSKQTALTSQAQAFANARQSAQNAQSDIAKAQLSIDKLKQPASISDLAAAQEKVNEAKQALVKLKIGPTSIDLLTAQNTVAQRQASVTQAVERLADAQDALKNYTIIAPFDGQVAKTSVKKGDQVSVSTALATLVTTQKVAELSLNEVDVAKLKVGQKATLTFDAVPELSIAGSVYEIDPIGTVTQGVVNYAVKILFQTQDERIKAGMSVSASIITDLRTDVVLIPNAALHRAGNETTVDILVNGQATSSAAAAVSGVVSTVPPEARVVQVGLSNDSQTEILQGLNEGEQVVTRTIDPNVQTAARTTTGATGATNGLRVQGLGGIGAGGGFGGGGFTGGARPVGR